MWLLPSIDARLTLSLDEEAADEEEEALFCWRIAAIRLIQVLGLTGDAAPSPSFAVEVVEAGAEGTRARLNPVLLAAGGEGFGMRRLKDVAGSMSSGASCDFLLGFLIVSGGGLDMA